MFVEVCKEYITSRFSDPALCTLLVGSITALAAAGAFSPARYVPNTVLLAGGVVRNALACGEMGHSAGRSKERPQHVALLQGNGLVPGSFLSKFCFLLRIAVPSLRSQESGMLIIISLLLLLRTYLSFRIARLTGQLTRALMQYNTSVTVKCLVVFLAWCIPSAVVNSSVRYCVEMLGLQFHVNLGRYFHQKYLNKDVFFLLASTSTVKDLDQRITTDIEHWAQGVSWLFVSFLKPMLDTLFFFFKVASFGGARSVWTVIIYYLGFSAIAYRFSRDMESVANNELKQEGAFVTTHERLIPYAEELVMTQGQRFHRHLMDSHFASLLQYKRWASYVRGRYGLVETIFMKYGFTFLSHIACGTAVLARGSEGMSEAEIYAMFAEMSLLFNNLSSAVRKLFKLLPKCIIIYALTNRVYGLHEGIAQVTTAPPAAATLDGIASGQVLRSDDIEFDCVPVRLPTGEVLCNALSFYVRPGMNVLVVGPNGCGKSSMLRLLGGLWPLQGGRISKPRDDQIFYIPQRPYMPAATLRDQITYPLRDSSLSVSESTLMTCLEMAMLDDIFLKPNITWDSFLSWETETLSIGEKQKLAMARLFFHRPRFAILDECSSMMDVDVEKRLYGVCHHLGISLITIAHRRSVWGYHNWILRFDGCGGFMFSPVTFDDGNGVVLTHVVTASDPSLLGKSVRFCLSQHDE